MQRGSDVLVVGRGIHTAPDVEADSEKYRDAGWTAYLASTDLAFLSNFMSY